MLYALCFVLCTLLVDYLLACVPVLTLLAVRLLACLLACLLAYGEVQEWRNGVWTEGVTERNGWLLLSESWRVLVVGAVCCVCLTLSIREHLQRLPVLDLHLVSTLPTALNGSRHTWLLRGTWGVAWLLEAS